MVADPKALATMYPRLFHMAEFGSWPSISKHGLLSTKALLDLFEVEDPRRTTILSQRRAVSVPITHPKIGAAVIRDQKPLSDAGLMRCLQDGLSPRRWYALLNDKVFFWVQEKRLEGLLNARAYRDLPHTVLTLSAAAVLAKYSRDVLLSGMNSGTTAPIAHPRGKNTFLSLEEFPLAQRIKKAGRKNAVVELLVSGGCPSVSGLVELVEHRFPDGRRETLFRA